MAIDWKKFTEQHHIKHLPLQEQLRLFKWENSYSEKPHQQQLTEDYTNASTSTPGKQPPNWYKLILLLHKNLRWLHSPPEPHSPAASPWCLREAPVACFAPSHVSYLNLPPEMKHVHAPRSASS